MLHVNKYKKEKYYSNELRVIQSQQEAKRWETKRKNASKYCSYWKKTRKKNTANKDNFSDDEVDNDADKLDAWKMLSLKKKSQHEKN